MTREMRHMVTHRIDEVLPRLAQRGCPVRVLRGEHDHVAPQAWTRAVARLAGAPAPAVIGRWGHVVQYGDPDAVAAEVLGLVADVTRGV
jgi:pimeloyl-ACP methyl ester carboxylesterase